MRKKITRAIVLLYVALLPILQIVIAKEISPSSLTARKITVTLMVNPELLPQNPEQWFLYVYATKPDTRLPLAIYKGKLSQLPLTIDLHQSMYLLPHLTLKDVENVNVFAKATKNKNPHQKSPDDIIGYSKMINFSTGPHQQVTLTINQHDKVVNPLLN